MQRPTASLVLLCVALSACILHQAAAGGVANTPADVLRLWAAREAADDVSPCLSFALCNWDNSNLDEYYAKCRRSIYQPGMDVLWISGARTIAQVLQWNAELAAPAVRPQLSWYIGNGQGFLASNSSDFLMFAWDQCAVEHALGKVEQVATPVAMADWAETRYGVRIPNQVLRIVVDAWWGVTNDAIWGAGCDLGCASGGFSDGQDCNCAPDIVAAWRYFSQFDPLASDFVAAGEEGKLASSADSKAHGGKAKYGSKHGKQSYYYPKHGKHYEAEEPAVSGNTAAACLERLAAICDDPRDCTPAVVRAGLGVCFNAFALNSGIGMGWTPLLAEMPLARFEYGLSNPEYQFPWTGNAVLREYGAQVQLELIYSK